MKKVFNFWFEVVDQKLVVMMIVNIIFTSLGNNKNNAKLSEKNNSFWLYVFDQKLTIKDDYEWFLQYLSKCWHGYVIYSWY